MLHVKHLLPLRLLKIKVSARKPIFGNHLNDPQFDGALHASAQWHDCQVQIFAHRIAVCLVLNPFLRFNRLSKVQVFWDLKSLQHTMNQHWQINQPQTNPFCFHHFQPYKKNPTKKQNIAASSSSSPLQVFCTSIIRLPK